MAINYVFLVILLACCGFALVSGGAPERIGAAIYAGGSFATVAVASAPPIRFHGVEVGVFIVDVFVFLGFVALALRANRFWPIWVSALVGIGLAGHLAMLLRPQVIPWAYAVVLSIWSYPILAMMTAGTVLHRRRRRRSGADPSWTRSSGPAGPATPPAGPMR